MIDATELGEQVFVYAPLGDTPVSYTHLDVYKRQKHKPKYSAFSSGRPRNFPSCPSMAGGMVVAFVPSSR